MIGLFKVLKDKDSLLAQKAKFKWLRKGDANTRFYNRVINKRRKRNEIAGITINNVWREEVQDIRRTFIISLRITTVQGLYLGRH